MTMRYGFNRKTNPKIYNTYSPYVYEVWQEQTLEGGNQYTDLLDIVFSLKAAKKIIRRWKERKV